MNKRLVALLLALTASNCPAGQAESEDAVTRILFEEDMQNVSSSFRSDGFVDIYLADPCWMRNTPEC